MLHQLYLWWHVRIRREPQMQIYGVRRGQVEEIVHQAGAMLVDVQENTSAGPDWTSARYCVAAPASEARLPKRGRIRTRAAPPPSQAAVGE